MQQQRLFKLYVSEITLKLCIVFAHNSCQINSLRYEITLDIMSFSGQICS